MLSTISKGKTTPQESSVSRSAVLPNPQSCNPGRAIAGSYSYPRLPSLYLDGVVSCIFVGFTLNLRATTYALASEGFRVGPNVTQGARLGNQPSQIWYLWLLSEAGLVANLFSKTVSWGWIEYNRPQNLNCLQLALYPNDHGMN